jgi:hypothetical protein
MANLELLTWEGCPSTAEALEICSRASSDLGIDLQILHREVNDYEIAQTEEFVGSPTFRVGGADLFDVSGQRFGLSCRVYKKPGGKFGPLPDYQEFKSALEAAVKRS